MKMTNDAKHQAVLEVGVNQLICPPVTFVLWDRKQKIGTLLVGEKKLIDSHAKVSVLSKHASAQLGMCQNNTTHSRRECEIAFFLLQKYY